jgi:hypothetical protein
MNHLVSSAEVPQIKRCFPERHVDQLVWLRRLAGDGRLVSGLTIRKGNAD